MIGLNMMVIPGLCACSAVSEMPKEPPDGSTSGGSMAMTYHGAVAQTPAVVFGGGGVECTYTVTLRQIDVQLEMLPPAQVTTGKVQALYDEELLSTCARRPANPAILNYAIVPVTGGSNEGALTFQEEPGDSPGASLVIALSANGIAYQAQLTFHRTDLGPPLDWTVMTSVSLSPRAP